MKIIFEKIKYKKDFILKSKNKESFDRKKKRGFTLVEVMITVTIIGILSSMAMLSYSKAQEKAKVNIDYATAANIATAAQVAATNGETGISVESLVSGGYLRSMPEVQQSSGGSFKVIVGDDDTVTVSIGDIQYYPKPNE
ncbi:type IV pilin protein [Intestinibacter sp.]|uniref:type IV pilin protein n=1 Tax=Intestinibacter sp. TaxID=1965304 RepID=UPI003F13882C